MLVSRSRLLIMSGTIPEGAIVWIKNPQKDSDEGFIKARICQFTEGRGYTVTASDGKERTVRAVDCAQANPDNMSTPDNCYLIHISESTILANMRARFRNRAIYTYTSNILIALNPFETLSIYGPNMMGAYVNKSLGSLEPHVYAMAEEAYKTLLKSGLSQSLVVSGESGAGKTGTLAKHERGRRRCARMAVVARVRLSRWAGAGLGPGPDGWRSSPGRAAALL